MKPNPDRRTTRYDSRSIMRRPEFWRGALSTRLALEADRSRTNLVANLLSVAESKNDPTETENFRLWLAQGSADKTANSRKP